MFGLGPWELAIIAVVVLLVFGNRLPSVMRSLGQGVVQFKKGLQDVEEEVKNSTNRIEEHSTKTSEKSGEAEPVQR